MPAALASASSGRVHARHWPFPIALSSRATASARWGALSLTIIGVAITWQTLRGAIMANIKEFASLRALGVGMGSLRRIVLELSFWVGIVGVAAAIFLTWLVSLLAAANAVIIALPFMLLVVVGGGLIVISMLSGLLSLGILKNSQPADLLR